VVAVGGTGVSRSQVSRICAQLDTDVAAWQARPLDEHAFPYVFLDATDCKIRINARVVSPEVIIATGVSVNSRREVLGCQVGDNSEPRASGPTPARPARPRSVRGAAGHQRQPPRPDPRRQHRDAGRELAALPGHMRNTPVTVSKGTPMVAATIWTIFVQPGPAEVRAQVDNVALMLNGGFPAVAQLLLDAKTT
jgi:putative transposase